MSKYKSGNELDRLLVLLIIAKIDYKLLEEKDIEHILKSISKNINTHEESLL